MYGAALSKLRRLAARGKAQTWVGLQAAQALTCKQAGCQEPDYGQTHQHVSGHNVQV